MKLKLIASAFIVFAALLSGCSKGPETSASTAADDPVLVGTTHEPSTADESPATNNARAGSDNSEIVTTRDEMGNYIETRTFRDNKHLGSVVIRTLADGTKIGSAFGKNGEKLPLADKHVALALSSGGDELAEMIGLVKPADDTRKPADLTIPVAYEPPPQRMVPEAPASAPTADRAAQELEKAREAAKQAEKVSRIQNDINRIQLKGTRN